MTDLGLMVMSSMHPPLCNSSILIMHVQGFALGAAIQSQTKGIWMWCVPHPKKTDHTLVLLDTEGLGVIRRVRHHFVAPSSHAA